MIRGLGKGKQPRRSEGGPRPRGVMGKPRQFSPAGEKRGRCAERNDEAAGRAESGLAGAAFLWFFLVAADKKE